MEIVYHIGAHETDENRLLKCLLKNRDTLTEQRIAVPNPGGYRKLLRELLSNQASPETQHMGRDEVIEAILGHQDAERVVMSNPNFCCINARIFEGGQFYKLGPPRVAALGELFAEDQLELHLAIRNPASFIPAVLSSLPDNARDHLVAELDPFDIRWSDVITRLREACPRAELTVWCNEDTPLIWSQLISEISGSEFNTPIIGGFDLLAEIMTEEGFSRFLKYLESHPPQTEVQKRRIIAAFLDKFALLEELEEELDMPGWTDETVDALTDAYEEDLYAIDRIHGVTLITP
ncbi:MAG: hypothetical protein MK180_14470 [Rhodobacteraceae bacterium]|nr:hypothetical protein [Paracoccaceae bacterium]